MNIISKKLKSKFFAFTLLEMSVVLAVIGFLASIIFFSQYLISKGNLDSIIAEVKKFSNAVTDFEIKYGSLPGDLSDITKLPNISPLPIAGNGDGILDSSEISQFWYHLKVAGLLAYNIDPSITYTIASYSNIGNLPGSNFKNLGYSVISNSANIIGFSSTNKVIARIIYNLSYFPASDYTTAIFTPEEAYYLDKKLDDGNALTGIFRATDGTGIMAGACQTGGSYNLGTITKSCYAQILTSTYTITTDFTSNTCSNSAFGANIYNSPCPDGYKGYISNHCNQNGNLVKTENYCESIKCGENLNYGDSISLPCPNDTIGMVRFTCGIGGVLQDVVHNSPQNFCSLISSASCTGNNNPVFNLTCPIGYVGVWQYQCVTGTPTVVSNTCIPIKCSGTQYLGEYNPTPTKDCSSPYYNYKDTKNNAVEACILPTGNNIIGQFRIIKSNCIPKTSSCLTGSPPRSIGCPRGQVGQHTQTCNNANFWETTTNTCAQVTCGGEPIGSFRIAQLGKTCPYKYGISTGKGVLLEVCDYTSDSIADNSFSKANWQISYINCQ